MINEVTIEGFKSFGSPGKPIFLGPLNFIVGANGCGKTNFVSALKFLRLSLMHGLEYTVNNEFNGCRELRNRILRERGEQKPCSIKVVLNEVNVQAENVRLRSAKYTLKVDLRSDDENPKVLEEKFSAQIEINGGNIQEYRLNRDQKEVKVFDPTVAIREKVELIHAPEAGRLAMASGFMGMPALMFRQIVEGWGFFSINSELARLSARETPSVELGSHGENLAAVLHEIEKRNGGGEMAGILNALKGAVPRIKQIKPVRTDVEGKWTFQILEERVRDLAPGSVSDGTIRLLTLLVATFWSSRASSLLVIEEPENNLHPHLFEQLVGIFREVSNTRQVIATTHSPLFLDYLEPKELLLCERDNESTFTHLTSSADREQIDIFRRKYTLGELWEQGLLGGIPG